MCAVSEGLCQCAVAGKAWGSSSARAAGVCDRLRKGVGQKPGWRYNLNGLLLRS